ncbi:MAG: M28 family peptidase [Anaerolineae bacterium]|nr:M28 family peptidase [Anaerolineae bacterium]
MKIINAKLKLFSSLLSHPLTPLLPCSLAPLLLRSLSFLPICLFLIACASSTPAPTPTPSPTPLPRTFTGEFAYTWVVRQCDLGPRVTGTEASRQAGDLFIAELQALGWEVLEQTFTYKETPVRNILAWKGEGEAVLLGAHYDSRRVADQEDTALPVMGANDGASGVAVLLELARALDWETVHQQVYLGFFDAEDNGHLDGWDWIIGSSYMAEHWGEAGESPLTAMILVDMIGDADQQVYYEQNSHPTLSHELWEVAAQLGYAERIIAQYKYAMLDDHIPFARQGIPAVDMIDFDYPYWHTTQDTADKVSAESLEAVGRTLEVWLEGN